MFFPVVDAAALTASISCTMASFAPCRSLDDADDPESVRRRLLPSPCLKEAHATSAPKIDHNTAVTH